MDNETTGRYHMDERLYWEQLKAGDQRGLKALYDLHVERLYAYGVSLCHDPEKVKDCLHDLFLSFWQQRQGLSIPDSGKAYLMVSLRRRLFDKGTKLEQQTGTIEDTGLEYTLGNEDHETEWIRNEDETAQARRLQEAMSRLSDRQREILHMKFFQQMEYEEIGQIMDLNYQSARNLVNRAINALRREMGVILLILWGLM